MTSCTDTEEVRVRNVSTFGGKTFKFPEFEMVCENIDRFVLFSGTGHTSCCPGTHNRTNERWERRTETIGINQRLERTFNLRERPLYVTEHLASSTSRPDRPRTSRTHRTT